MKRLFTWLMLAFAGVLLLATLIRTVSLSISLQESIAGEAADAAMEDAREIAAWAQSRWERPPDEVRFSLGALGDVAGARVWLVGADGVVRVDTEGNPSWEGATIRAPELERALRGQEALVSGRSPWLESAVAGVVPVVLDGRPLGAVFLFLPTEDAAAAPELAGPLLWSGVLALSLAAVVAYLVARKLARPVEQITGFARALGRGQFGEGLSVRSFAEVNELAATLSQVSRRLEASFTALSEERQRLAAILDSMHEGVLAVSAGGEVILVNEAALRLLHWDPPPELPLPLPEAAVPARLRRALAAAVQGESQEIGLHPRGSDDLLAACFPVPVPGEQPGAVAVLRDLSALMRLQRLRENLVADVAHELRSPLTNLSVLTEALVDGTLPWDDPGQFVPLLQDEVSRLRRLSSDVLDLARMDAGVLSVTLEPVDLAEVAALVAERIAARAAGAGVAVICEVPPGIRAVASRDRMEQVLLNLAENALRHTPPGGRVTIAAAADGDRVHITVADTGVGIAAEHLPQIFERFYKADPARTRTDAGTGLGLAVVKQLVELQGGSVEAQSTAGEGSAFTVTLPAA